MSTMTNTLSTASIPLPQAKTGAPGRLSFGRLVHSEWLKLATLRSPWWSIVIVAGLTVALGMLAVSSMTDDLAAGADSGAVAIQAVLAPTTFTVLLATILGSTLVTSEYATGMMRSTLTAAPGRIGSLLAKALVVGGFVFLASGLIFVGTAAAIAPTLSGNGVYFDLSNPNLSYLPILAGSFMMAVIAVIGMSAGYILRNASGAIATAVGLVFVLPLLPRLFPQTPAYQWVHDASQYLPTGAGGALISSNTPGFQTLTASNLPAGAAAITLIVWACVGIVASAVCLKARDA
jgi:ABC-2 type transport system permease protein